MDAEPQALTIQEVCERTRLSRSTIYSLIKQGRFPRQLKSGRSSRWLRAELADWFVVRAQDRGQ
ncbi:MAG: helix-turn-helix domain-containing protein [Pseudoxanthomonas sp.]|nr:helix-turn-helix domain-containing protein [Pseudoxanthomonas sp.]